MHPEGLEPSTSRLKAASSTTELRVRLRFVAFAILYFVFEATFSLHICNVFFKKLLRTKGFNK